MYLFIDYRYIIPKDAVLYCIVLMKYVFLLKRYTTEYCSVSCTYQV